MKMNKKAPIWALNGQKHSKTWIQAKMSNLGGIYPQIFAASFLGLQNA